MKTCDGCEHAAHWVEHGEFFWDCGKKLPPEIDDSRMEISLESVLLAFADRCPFYTPLPGAPE